MQNKKSGNIRLVSIILLITSACRPVITVGWGEIAFVVVFLLLLLGPSLYRLIRRLAEFQAWKNSSKKK